MNDIKNLKNSFWYASVVMSVIAVITFLVMIITSVEIIYFVPIIIMLLVQGLIFFFDIRTLESIENVNGFRNKTGLHLLIYAIVLGLLASQNIVYAIVGAISLIVYRKLFFYLSLKKGSEGI